MSDRPKVHSPKPDSKQLAREQRSARLAAELRSNLRRRKEQARRAGQEARGSDNGLDNGNAREAATADKRGPTEEVA